MDALLRIKPPRDGFWRAGIQFPSARDWTEVDGRELSQRQFFQLLADRGLTIEHAETGDAEEPTFVVATDHDRNLAAHLLRFPEDQWDEQTRTWIDDNFQLLVPDIGAKAADAGDASNSIPELASGGSEGAGASSDTTAPASADVVTEPRKDAPTTGATEGSAGAPLTDATVPQVSGDEAKKLDADAAAAPVVEATTTAPAPEALVPKKAPKPKTPATPKAAKPKAAKAPKAAGGAGAAK